MHMIDSMKTKGIGILASHIPISGDHSWFMDLFIDSQHTTVPGLKRKGQCLWVDE